jgi:polysaccharide biosynthesis transport protein
LRAQVADLDRQLRVEADRIARSLENDAKLVSGRVDSLSSGLDQLKRQAASTNEQDVQLRALERDAKSQRDLLESYLAKYREATARDSIGAASSDARIISAAVVSSTPSWPKKIPTILVAALAMFVLSSGVVVSSQLLSALPMQPVAGATPVSSAVPAQRGRDDQGRDDQGRDLAAAVKAIEAARAQAGAAADAIEGLARDLGAAGEGARRITVVGAMRDVGATMTAIALARSLAQQSRVVLVDLTLGAPHLAIIASDPAAPGLAELVAGSASFGQIITRDRYSRVHLVMAGRGRPEEPLDAGAIVGSQQLSIAIEALGRSYDHVVLDAGAATEASLDLLARLAPRAVLVAPELDNPETADAREQLLQAGFANVSVLVSASRGANVGAGGAKAAA